MSREDTYKDRHPIAKEIEKRLKDEEDWKKCDSGRMGPSSNNDNYSNDYRHLSDKELIDKYIEKQQIEEYWKDDRR